MSRRIACIRIPLPTGAPAPAAEARAALAGALLAAAPRVVPVAGHPLAFWADLAGMERLGGDEAVALRLIESARGLGYEARVGVAAGCIAAAAATRERRHDVRIVPPGHDAAYLRRRSLALLPLPAGLRQALSLLGLHTCGDLAALPPAEVELRFGADGLRARRLATGDDSRWPFRPAAPGTATAEAEFEPPVESTEALRFVLPGLVAQVVDQLAMRQRIPVRLRMTLRLDGAPDEVREIRPARATGDPRVLADLCRRAAESAPLAAPLCGVRLDAPDEGVSRADQLDAFRAPAPDPGALHAALLPVLARWGDGALSQAAMHGAHLPGEHAGWVGQGSGGIAAFAAAPAPEPESSAPVRGFRNALPLCLRRLPAPLAVTVREDEGRRPARVALPADGNVLSNGGIGGFPPRMWKTFAQGPERVSVRWWGVPEAREYWRVESPEGWLGLVFRDAPTGRWYLEGWFD